MNKNGSTTTAAEQTENRTWATHRPADRLNGAKLMSANDFIGKRVYDRWVPTSAR